MAPVPPNTFVLPVVDPNGRPLGTVTLPESLPIIGILAEPPDDFEPPRAATSSER